MTKPIEDSTNAAAIRTALDVPTTAALNAKYTKPSGGIPATDLDADPAGHVLLTATSASERKQVLGLDQVNNTSDANKPISAAQQAALDAKMAATLPAMQTVFDTGTAPQKAAFQSSVSGDLLRLARKPRLTAKRVPVIGVIGNSIARNQYSPAGYGGLVGSVRIHTLFGAFGFLGTGELGITDLYAYEGFSGYKSSEILAALSPSGTTEVWGAAQTQLIGIAGRLPDIVVIVPGTNDIALATVADIDSGKALNLSLSGITALIDYVQKIGAIPVVVNNMPLEGLTVLVAGAKVLNLLTDLVPTWNTAIAALCDRLGAHVCDAFTACAIGGTGADRNKWKPGYSWHAGNGGVEGGAPNSWKVHPSFLASSAIGAALRKSLIDAIQAAPTVPRVYPGGSPVYSRAFSATAPGTYFSQFGGASAGLFQSGTSSLDGWFKDFDPKANTVVSVLTGANSIDTISGGNTLSIRKPSDSASGYVQIGSASVAVAAGQKYVFAADINFTTADNLAGFSFNVVDRTSGSGSLGQPLASFNLSANESNAAISTGTIRVSTAYEIPTGINSVRINAIMTRDAGGVVGFDELKIANCANIRIA